MYVCMSVIQKMHQHSTANITVLQRVGLGQLRVDWTDGVESGLGCLWIPRVGGPRGEVP